MDVRDAIMGCVDKTGRKLTWLSKETGIPYNSLYAILKLKTTKLNSERLTLIKTALNIKFKK